MDVDKVERIMGLMRENRVLSIEVTGEGERLAMTLAPNAFMPADLASATVPDAFKSEDEKKKEAEDLLYYSAK